MDRGLRARRRRLSQRQTCRGAWCEETDGTQAGGCGVERAVHLRALKGEEERMCDLPVRGLDHPIGDDEEEGEDCAGLCARTRA